ncbi:hypothetical protein HD806DRAFT_486633 [Xylariaceae sp. AK1471]|nr:hypothetical protein HD806DRAFT_486633 [Xylariaceae sp. AK1471]
MFEYRKTGPGHYVVSVDPCEELLFEALCIKLSYNIDRASETSIGDDKNCSTYSLNDPSSSPPGSPGNPADDRKGGNVDRPEPKSVTGEPTYPQHALEESNSQDSQDSQKSQDSQTSADSADSATTITIDAPEKPINPIPPQPVLLPRKPGPKRPRPRPAPGRPTYSLGERRGIDRL